MPEYQIVTDYNTRAELVKHNASDLDVARAAWVSNYGSDAREKDSERVEGLIRFLYKNNHTSPFEHNFFTFWIDCPIFVGREFMRHRTFSYNEVSGRYKMLEGRFYVPAQGRPLAQVGKPGAYSFEAGTDEQYVTMLLAHQASYEESWKQYNHMLEAGIAREVARNVLPVGIFTQFYASCNMLNLMRFLILRNDPQALQEIQYVARQMEAVFAQAAPLTYKAFVDRRTELQENEKYKQKWESLVEFLREHWVLDEIDERLLV